MRGWHEGLRSYARGDAEHSSVNWLRPPSKAAALAAAVVPLAALLIFANQLYRVSQFDLSPWKGGGFGMFSTIDKPSSRFLKIYVRVDGAYLPVALGSRFSAKASALRVEPSPAKLASLSKAIMAAPWVVTGQYRDVSPLLAGDGAKAPDYRPVIAIRAGPLRPLETELTVDAVRLEVWRLTYDREQGRVQARPIMGDTYEPRKEF